MPQRLYTGAMGAGKTLLVMSHLVKEVELNMKRPADKQRKIYCDITGLKIEGIEQPPIDWRLTPPNSLLIYDEAQEHPEFHPSRGLSPYDFVQYITHIRKLGHEIWYITQDPKRLHTNITDLIHEHYHVERKWGAELSTIYMWSRGETSPRSPSVQDRADRKSLFHYDKKLYDLYESAQVEDDGFKFKPPWKLIVYACVPLLLFGFSAYMWFSPDTQNMVAGAEDTIQETTTTVTNPMLAEQSQQIQQALPTPEQFEQTRVAMVIASTNGCIAKNRYGTPI